jgi:hypothetical protein
MLLSPLTHAALIVAAIYSFGGVSFDWRSVAISTLPTVLGFSLAAYVIIFTLMGGELHSALTQIIAKRRSANYLLIINSTFFHAIFVQVVAYIYSIFSRGDLFAAMARGNHIIGFPALDAEILLISATNLTGAFLTSYSLFLILGILVAVFRLASATQPRPDRSTETEDNSHVSVQPVASRNDEDESQL